MIDLQRADPIFIHGLLPRSGTNFLCDLLLLHPDCAPAIEPVHEDLFLEHSDHLVAFARSVRAAWDPRWGDFDDLPARLAASAARYSTVPLSSGLRAAASGAWSHRARARS